MRESWGEPMLVGTVTLVAFFSALAITTGNAIWGVPAGLSVAGAWILWSRRNRGDSGPGS